jgi:hypothetical protein
MKLLEQGFKPPHGPSKGIFILQVEYGCYYNALDNRDGSKGLDNGRGGP